MNAFIQFGRDQINCWSITIPEGRVLRKVSLAPYVALSRKALKPSLFAEPRQFLPTMKPIAYGKDAQKYSEDQTADPFCCAPFSNANISVSHTEGAIHLFQYLLKHNSQGDFAAKLIRPRIILHPVNAKNRGLTDFESNALIRLAMDAGAREADIANPDLEFNELIFQKMFKEGTNASPQSSAIEIRKIIFVIIIVILMALYVFFRFT